MHFAVWGQVCKYNISGIVLDKGTNVPLSYASIRLIETSQGALANDQGEFSVDRICLGDYHIKISHVGFEEEKFFVKITSDTVITFELNHHDELLLK